MNLRDFLASRSGKEELYWAIVVEPGWVHAGVWGIVGDKAEIITVSPTTAWEVDEELIAAADAALSAAIQSLPEETQEPTKTVFGVPISWVSEGQIKVEYLNKIKKLCSDLSLEPAGFVVLPEAIAHLVKSEEGTPLNAEVLGIGKNEVELAVFRLGNLVGTTTVARSVSIVEDVTEGLTRIAHSDPLPSRLLIYNGKEGDLEEVRQTLLEVDWDQKGKIKFLHTPKIEIVKPDRKVLATALAGASEIAHITSIGVLPKTPEEAHEGENLDKKESRGALALDEAKDASELGFVVGKDIREGKKPETPPPILPPSPLPIPQTTSPKIVSQFSSARKEILSVGFLKKIKDNLLGLLSKIKLPFNQGVSQKTLILGGSFFLAILLAGFLFWWFYPKAVVTIYVAPTKIEEKVEVSFDTGRSSPDFPARVLAAQSVSKEVSGEKTKQTSGTKTVGEAAKGTVKIQNGTSSNINLASGTVLLASNDLRFTTASLASVSAALSPTSPGTASVEVEAAAIGSEYNLAKDESFKVGNYPKSEVDGVSVSDFTGGSSREISAVSEEDQSTLEEDLKEELLDKANGEITEGLAAEKLFIKDSIFATPSSRSFSNKVGDEATTLKLSLDLSLEGLTVIKNDLFELTQQILKDKIPSSYVLRDEQVTYDFELKERDENLFVFDYRIIANLLPEVKAEEIAKQIAGKYPGSAQEYLTSISGFTRAEVKLSPKFPGRLSTLPRVVKNITVEVTAEQ